MRKPSFLLLFGLFLASLPLAAQQATTAAAAPEIAYRGFGLLFMVRGVTLESFAGGFGSKYWMSGNTVLRADGTIGYTADSTISNGDRDRPHYHESVVSKNFHFFTSLGIEQHL